MDKKSIKILIAILSIVVGYALIFCLLTVISLKLAFIVGGALAVVIAIGIIIYIKKSNPTINLNEVDSDDDDFIEELKAYVEGKIAEDQEDAMKHPHKRNQVVTNFYSLYDYAFGCIFDDNRLSPEFLSFVDREYPGTIKKKDLYSIFWYYMESYTDQLNTKSTDFVKESGMLTPDEFFILKQRQEGDFVGVYVIYNATKKMYYVGQAKRLFFRISQHFTGHGNGDVYADYKYGDRFTIQIVKLSDSGYDDLDLLEKILIDKYDAYRAGYNKTSGNG